MNASLKDRIKLAGKTQSQVAAAAGVTHWHLSRLINKGVMPHRLTARSIAKVLKCRPADLGWGCKDR